MSKQSAHRRVVAFKILESTREVEEAEWLGEAPTIDDVDECLTAIFGSTVECNEVQYAHAA